MGTTETLHSYPVVRQEYCVMQYGCKNCIPICPEGAIKPVISNQLSVISKDKTDNRQPITDNRKIAFIEPELCERCGLCYQVCPTNAIEDVNATDYRAKALESAGKGGTIIFACEHTDFNSELRTPNSELISVPDISIVPWRDIFKVMSKGSAVVMIGCENCSQTGHFRQMEGMFANSCYEGAFRFFDNKEQLSVIRYQLSDKRHALDEGILEKVITSYEGKIPFPGTAWVDIGKRCTLCQNCAKICPTGALKVKSTEGKTVLLYEHNLCKGCPICEKACPERCITIDRRLRLDSLFTTDVKCEQNALFCRGCDRPIATDAVFEKVKNILIAHGQFTDHLEYCPDCKARGGKLSLRVPIDSGRSNLREEVAPVFPPLTGEN